MPVPKSLEARRYYRVALQRLEDGQLIFASLERYPAAIYLAGYGVECILKALILTYVPAARHALVLKDDFRGGKGHDVTWLRERLLIAGGPRFPSMISRDLTFVSTWSVDLRYTPGMGDRDEAREFLEAVQRIVTFCNTRLS